MLSNWFETKDIGKTPQEAEPKLHGFNRYMSSNMVKQARNNIHLAAKEDKPSTSSHSGATTWWSKRETTDTWQQKRTSLQPLVIQVFTFFLTR
ncbi:hypothetical protein SUGI_0268640 [Cryptomeria japonica]|nr:hypothetical protein SUGI_0268640 [Cryptomeria japonica]